MLSLPGGPGSIPGPGTRILQVTWYGQKKKKKKKRRRKGRDTEREKSNIKGNKKKSFGKK